MGSGKNQAGAIDMRRPATWLIILGMVPAFVPLASGHETPEPLCTSFSLNGVTQVSIIFPGGSTWVGVTGVAGRELWTFAATQTPIETLHWVLRPVPHLDQPERTGSLDLFSPLLIVDEENPHDALCLEVHNPSTQHMTVTMGFRSFAASQ